MLLLQFIEIHTIYIFRSAFSSIQNPFLTIIKYAIHILIPLKTTRFIQIDTLSHLHYNIIYTQMQI